MHKVAEIQVLPLGVVANVDTTGIDREVRRWQAVIYHSPAERVDARKQRDRQVHLNAHQLGHAAQRPLVFRRKPLTLLVITEIQIKHAHPRPAFYCGPTHKSRPIPIFIGLDTDFMNVFIHETMESRTVFEVHHLFATSLLDSAHSHHHTGGPPFITSFNPSYAAPNRITILSPPTFTRC